MWRLPTQRGSNFGCVSPQMIKKVNENDLEWEVPTHEDPNSPNTWKKVIVGHADVDPQSKLMMVNIARVLPGKIHPGHSHKTMEEIFLFLEGNGEIKVDDETTTVTTGDRIIVPAKCDHEIRNTGSNELKFIGFGIALD